jgi:hypothetical protein
MLIESANLTSTGRPRGQALFGSLSHSKSDGRSREGVAFLGGELC